MKQMQHNFLFFLLFSFILAACSEEEDERTEESLKCLTITETTGSGTEQVTTEQKFIYTDGKLTRHVTKQTYTDLWLKGEYTHSVSTQISYELGKVIVTDETGTVFTYQINEKGYATMCTRNEPGSSIRTYIFSYSTGGSEYLTGIKESIDGSPYSEISIEFPDNSTMNITEKANTIQSKFIASVNGNHPGVSNEKSQLPCLFLSERYPLSFHVEAFYANILGEPLATLPGQLTIENSEEVTTYEYTQDQKGYITSCATKISVPGRSWNRYVQYSYLLN